MTEINIISINSGEAFLPGGVIVPFSDAADFYAWRQQHGDKDLPATWQDTVAWHRQLEPRRPLPAVLQAIISKTNPDTDADDDDSDTTTAIDD